MSFDLVICYIAVYTSAGVVFCCISVKLASQVSLFAWNCQSDRGLLLRNMEYFVDRTRSTVIVIGSGIEFKMHIDAG